MKTALVHSSQFSRFDYGPEHPLRMERLGLTWRLIQAYGLTDLPETTVHEAPAADETDIGRFHIQEYVAILKASDGGRPPAVAEAFGLGPGDNPVFPGLWEASRLVAGASLLAADLVASGTVDRAFNFSGGLHHAMPDRASGFCYVNDAVLAIMHLRVRGLRVCYVDIDAHHGDGVQAAFYGDPSVMTISTHERGDRLFPGTGFVEEWGRGEGVGFSVNVPLDVLTDSAIFHRAFEAVVPRVVEAFRPDVVVAQLGVDAHRTDPLTHLALDMQGFLRAVRRVLDLCPRVVALGGGGYDLENVPRAWAGAWAIMNGVELPDALPEAFLEHARWYRLRSRTLSDPEMVLDDDRRSRTREYVDRQVEAVQRLIFPLHGI